MKWKFLLATLAYTALAYYDIYEERESLGKFRLAVVVYALLMFSFDLNDLFTPRGASQLDLSHYTAGLGYSLLFLAALFNNTFLEGKTYLAATSIITLSTQLKISTIVCKKFNSTSNTEKGYPDKCTRLVLIVAIGFCMFFSVAAATLIPEHLYSGLESAIKVCMWVSIVLHFAAAYYLLDEEEECTGIFKLRYSFVEFLLWKG